MFVVCIYIEAAKSIFLSHAGERLHYLFYERTYVSKLFKLRAVEVDSVCILF